MPSNKKKKISKVEKMRRKIKSHSINTRKAMTSNTWARSEQKKKCCSKMYFANEFVKVLKLK